eukprot:symbB.v1.2.028765.t1/scaffold3080.1/size64911/3
MQDVCEHLMSPLSENMTCYNEWFQAVESIDNARDLAQVTRCGKASLMQVSERLQQWKSEATMGRSKEKLLTDCCHSFIEHCAEIVEMSGVTPKLASNLLGASIRMAEVVGKTGTLLFAMESEFAQLTDKVSRIELVYDVAVKCVESVAGEISQLNKKAEAATARAETAQKRESELKIQCQQLKRSLSRTSRAREMKDKDVVKIPGRDPHPKLTPSSSTSSTRHKGLDHPRVGPSGNWLQRDLQRNESNHESNHSMHERMQRETIHNSGLYEAKYLQGDQGASYHSALSQLGSPSVESIPWPSRSGPPESLPSIFQDPLEGAVQASFDHLLTLLQQVEDLHGISHPSFRSLLSFASSNAAISPSLKDINILSVVNTIDSWVDGTLKFQDPVLATSVKQSASHLQCLCHLLHGESS